MNLRWKRLCPRTALAAGLLADLVLVGVCLQPAAFAQNRQVTVHFDPAATTIRWTLGGNLHATRGTFKLKGGVVSFDPATGAASGELLVDLASGESGNRDRDAKMRKQVLESDKYPEAFFHPEKIVGALQPGATQTIAADGAFNIHGADHPLHVRIQVQFDGSHATATARFSVPYVAWGMKDPSGFLLRVGKQVEIEIVAHGTVDGGGEAQRDPPGP